MKNRLRHKDEIILNALKKYNYNGELKVIDLGADKGILREHVPANMKYLSLDINPESKPDICCDLNKKLPIKDETYDFVIASEVLEHTLYPRKIIKEMIRITKKGGMIIITLPNEYNLYLRLKFLLGFQNNCDIPFREDLWRNHVQRARIKDIIKFYKDYFNIMELSYSWDSFSDKKFNWIFDSIIRRILMPISKNLFARSVLMISRK